MGAGLSRETERRQRQRKRLLRLRAAPYSGACTHDDALMGVNYSWSRGSQRGSRRGNGEKSVENGFTNLRRMSAVATVAFRLRPQSGTHRLFIGPTAKGRSGSIWSVRRAVGERPLFAHSGRPHQRLRTARLRPSRSVPTRVALTEIGTIASPPQGSAPFRPPEQSRPRRARLRCRAPGTSPPRPTNGGEGPSPARHPCGAACARSSRRA